MCRLAELLLICVISLTVKPAEGKATGRALKVEFVGFEVLEMFSSFYQSGVSWTETGVLAVHVYELD